jgi:predicted transcriptional regulator
MNRSFLIALLFTAWIFLLTAEGLSQDNENILTVETEGKGLITNDDVASARKNAISDALRNAVEQAVAKLILGQTLDKKSQAMRDGIYAKSDQYIRDYRINSERQVQKVYAVDVRSAVFIDSIRDDLQTLGLLKVEKNRVQATEVTITVKGLTSCADYARVKELLKTRVKGVRNVYQRELTWGTARLNLDIQGSVQSFSDELTKAGHFSPIIVIEQNYFDVTFLK